MRQLKLKALLDVYASPEQITELPRGLDAAKLP